MKNSDKRNGAEWMEYSCSNFDIQPKKSSGEKVKLSLQLFCSETME